MGVKTHIVAWLLLALACSPAHATDEACRIRIDNSPGGLVQVSVDGGRTWGCVGRVTTPANARIIGFAAASYTPQGTVAATAVHGIRIKTGQQALGVGKSQMPVIFSIVPLEFARIPEGYGGHVPRSSGILTDICAGHSIFRNQSPYVGNKVYFERERKLMPLPEDYTPTVGDVFVITVTRPHDSPTEVVFENTAGGRVTAKYADSTSKHIARVVRPVTAVGRYDGTTFTGVGAINTNHGGVITISTAPVAPPATREGGEVETRGGFMIQPSRHVLEQNETKPQVMVIAPVDESKPALEGTPPLFSGHIDLRRFPESPENSCRVQVKIDGGPWERPPEIVGRVDDAFTAGYLESYFRKTEYPRHIESGVTSIRLLFSKCDPELIARDLADEVADYTARAVRSGVRTVSGDVVLAPKKPWDDGCVVDFYVDGRLIYTCNRAPCHYTWDSTKVANGFHSIEIETLPASGADPIIEKHSLCVHN